ncbi:MAG: hypothetical protein VX529_08100 [Pseudomonadota bacterium]|nr:hypothetical protein [Pseudomonadota bacterium]
MADADKIDVRATQPGYYGGILRREGDTFTVEGQKAFSAVWMERDRGGDAPAAAEAADQEPGLKPKKGGKPAPDLKPKRIMRPPKLFKDDARGREVAFDTAFESALVKYCQSENGSVEKWNDLSDDQRRNLIQSEADRLLAAAPI